MAIHSSFKNSGTMKRHRSVLSRLERIKLLQERGLLDLEQSSLLGLPKVKHLKIRVWKERAAASVAGTAAAPGAAPAEGAAPAAPAAGKGAPAGKAVAGKAVAGKAAPASKAAAPPAKPESGSPAKKKE